MIFLSEIADGLVRYVNKGPSELLQIAEGICNDDNVDGCLNDVAFRSA